MGLGACYTCIKYLMFTFNILFWILGCAILGVGIWFRVDPNFSDYVAISDSEYLYNASYLFIAVGAVIMFLGFLGCCGAIKESQCMLATFFVFLFVIFAVLLAAGIYAATNQTELEAEVTKTLKDQVEKAKKTDDAGKEAQDRMNSIQKSLECCGGETSADWGVATNIPVSCYKDGDAKNAVYSNGCGKAMFTKLESNLMVVTGVGIGIAVVMLFGMIFAMMLCCAIRDTKA